MTVRKALVLVGSEERTVLMDTLSEMGFHVYTSGSIQEALGEIHHHDFTSVIIDHDNDEVDPLELVLNVREIDGKVPVIVLGESKEQGANHVLSNQRHVYRLTAEGAELKRRISGIIEARPDRES